MELPFLEKLNVIIGAGFTAVDPVTMRLVGGIEMMPSVLFCRSLIVLEDAHWWT